ncbi:MAG: hypothetical protein MI741_17020 [Rhodospirillales bacterium]|nr:hypothetical protein [Rhodospirillales bacterium]
MTQVGSNTKGGLATWRAEVVDRGKMLAIKLLVRTADAIGAHALLAVLFNRFLADIGEDGTLKPLSRPVESGPPTILFLNRPHYLDVVKTLASCGDFRCIDVSWGFLRYLLAAFVPEPDQSDLMPGSMGGRHDFRMAGPGTAIFERRKKYRAFLRKLLPLWFRRNGIDIVLNSDARYRREADVAQVASELGFPHICIPRDSMFTISGTFSQSVKRHHLLGTFIGDQILVQNDVTRRVLLESGYARRDQITILGSIKMDSFLNRLRDQAGPPSGRKMVLMFTWPIWRPMNDGAAFDLDDCAKHTIRAMARVAVLRPDVDFVVKPKKNHVRVGQIEPYREIVSEVSGLPDGVSNFRFLEQDAAVSDLILDASVICTMQSTTVLEAAVTGKPIILPHLRAVREHPHADEVLMYADSRHLFDVPDDEDDLVRLIDWRLEDDTVPEEMRRERRELFSRHIAPLTGDGAERCANLLKKYVAEGRRQRAAGRMPEGMVNA